MILTFEQKLRNYARLTIHSGVAPTSGQEVIIGADIGEASFMRLLVEEAYKAGVKYVFPMYLDDQTALIRYANASQEALEYGPKWLYDAMAERILKGAVHVRVFGTDPNLLRDVPREKINVSSQAQAVASAKLSESITGDTEGSFCIVAHPSAGWAKAVYPDLPAEEAISKLWDAIFFCTFADTQDPVASWNEHMQEIEGKRDALNANGYTALHITGNGTDLRVGLAEGSRFAGGRLWRADRAFSPNIPTEEVFTMPHRDRVDGVAKSSMPLSVRGVVIDGIEMTFEKGRVVKASARQGEDVLLGLFDTDEGAKHLGEVALVPNSSRVSQTKTLFFNTLYDENAACHIALGRAIGENMSDFNSLSPDERLARGANDSLIHVDWMIGCAETNVDGVTADGKTEPLMRSGEWV